MQSTDSYLGDGLTNPTIPPKFRAKVTYSTVELGRHVVVGSGCVIHPNVLLGDGVAVGSMSLVTKSLDPWGVYVGIPVRRIKDREKTTILEFERQLLEG